FPGLRSQTGVWEREDGRRNDGMKPAERVVIWPCSGPAARYIPMIPRPAIYSPPPRFFRVFLLALLTAFLWSGLSPVRGAGNGWHPKRTWVVVVGVLEWQQSKNFASFPQKDRRDAELVDFFRASGVPAAQVIFLKDRQATRRNIDNALAKVLTQTRKGDLLFLYYAGHGTKGKDNAVYFANYDA